MLKFCPYCGEKILDPNVNFCMSCGKSLAAFMNVPNSESKSATKSPVNTRKSNSMRNAPAPANQDIEKALTECRSAAEEGYQIADEKYTEILATLYEESQHLDDANAEQNQVDRIKNDDLIKNQETELGKLAQSIDAIGDDLENLHNSQKDFSIIVYGRTMAGKSTLMEILTRGNGKSIGRGSQRTTRDVRNYYWNGLKITDVPGICAFDGAEDERLAMEAAKSADLIIFLITNDAPQADEAACLAQLKSLGKPVLGLINVKSEFNLNSPDWDLDLEDLQEKLADTSTINSIVNQFKAFDKRHNQDWSDIKFVATHLLSAYEAHPCRGNNEQVYAASQFAQVENFILEKVMYDGRFLRIKNFIDAVAVPMYNIILKVYEHSADALLQSDIWFDKRVQLIEWRNEFIERSQKKFDAIYQRLSDNLKNEIYDFAELNYENKNAGISWKSRIRNLKWDTRYQDLLKKLAKECERKRKELSDELTQEIKFAFQSGADVNVGEVDSTTPVGEYLGAGLGAAGGLAAIAFPPIGIAIGVVGLLTGIFSESREEKIRKNKQKLREAVTQPSFEILDKIHNQAIEIFNTEILNKGVDEFQDLLANYQFMFARLGKSQGDMANNLSFEYRHLNAILLGEAIDYTNAGSFSKDDAEFPMRIPGERMVLLADKSNLDNDAISALLGEKFVSLKPKQEFPDTVKMLLGCDYQVDSYKLEFDTEEKEGEETIALFPDKVNERKINMVQQIAGVPIIWR